MTTLPTLHTARLVLRPFLLSDARQVQALAGDTAVAATTSNVPHPYLDGMAESWISTHEQAFADRASLTLAMVRKDDDALVGCMSFCTLSEKHGTGELGYWVGKAYWNQGLASEAARALLEYGFNVLGLRKVFARFYGSNPASGRVMEKLGMTFEGRLREHVRKWDRVEDCVFYGILKSEFETARGK